MSRSNLDVVRTAIEELFNRDRYELAPDLYATSCEGLDPAYGDAVVGPDQVVALLRMYRAAFSDYFYTLDDLFGAGGRVVARWTARGTHDGEFLGVPPTGRTFNIQGVSICLMRDGKIQAVWQQFDRLSLASQLGLTVDQLDLTRACA